MLYTKEDSAFVHALSSSETVRYFLTSQETSVSEELNLPALATCCVANKYKIDCRVKPDNDKQTSLCSKLEVKVCGASFSQKKTRRKTRKQTKDLRCTLFGLRHISDDNFKPSIKVVINENGGVAGGGHSTGRMILKPILINVCVQPPAGMGYGEDGSEANG